MPPGVLIEGGVIVNAAKSADSVVVSAGTISMNGGALAAALSDATAATAAGRE